MNYRSLLSAVLTLALLLLAVPVPVAEGSPSPTELRNQGLALLENEKPAEAQSGHPALRSTTDPTLEMRSK